MIVRDKENGRDPCQGKKAQTKLLVLSTLTYGRCAPLLLLAVLDQKDLILCDILLAFHPMLTRYLDINMCHGKLMSPSLGVRERKTCLVRCEK